MSANERAATEIRRLYYAATRTTIKEDFRRAIELVKAMGSEEERERVAVYMDGLSQMRSEWAAPGSGQPARGPRRRRKRKP